MSFIRSSSIFHVGLLALCICSCGGQTDESNHGDTEEEFVAKSPWVDHDLDFVDDIEKAHGKKVVMDHEAVAFDVSLEFGGKERLKGRLTLLTNNRKGRLDLENGETIIFNDGEVFYSPQVGSASKARFDAYTWSYFFMLPYKLSDPGTIWTENSGLGFQEEEMVSMKLSFEGGTGDAPDDWYRIYADESSQLIHTAAYIVTAGKTTEEAEKNPHAIVYSDYKDFDGVPFATKWYFHDWSKDEGLGDQLGSAEVFNVALLDVEEEIFTAPADFLEASIV